MAYDRYDTRDDPREGRARWRDERSEGRGWGGERHRGGGEDRGWFERMGDEVRSWFGDEDDDRRGDWRERGPERRFERGPERGHDRNEDRGRFWRDRSWDSGDWERDETGGNWGRGRAFGREREPGFGRDRERGYRPMTGDYGRSERGRSQSRWDRDDIRRTSFAGSAEPSRGYDPNYDNWRRRHMDDLDRDYDEFRREHQSRFEDDFSSWRERRMQKRGLLGQIRENMEVVGNDGEPVGTVERTAGDRIILAKTGEESGGTHHSLSCSEIDRVEDNRVILDCSATEARVRWRDEDRSRALFEREDQGEMGPHVLDRSFEGTYR